MDLERWGQAATDPVLTTTVLLLLAAAAAATVLVLAVAHTVRQAQLACKQRRYIGRHRKVEEMEP